MSALCERIYGAKRPIIMSDQNEITIDEIAAEMRDEILAIVDEQNAIIASLNDDKLCHLTIGQAAITAFTDALPADKAARLNTLAEKKTGLTDNLLSYVARQNQMDL